MNVMRNCTLMEVRRRVRRVVTAQSVTRKLKADQKKEAVHTECSIRAFDARGLRRCARTASKDAKSLCDHALRSDVNIRSVEAAKLEPSEVLRECSRQILEN